jgi:hypothetical protein
MDAEQHSPDRLEIEIVDDSPREIQNLRDESPEN